MKFLKESDLIKYWDFEKNYDIDIEKVCLGSNKSYYWKCPKCGYRFRRRIWRMSKENNNCPKCSRIERHKKYIEENGSILNRDDLIREWDYGENNKLGIFPENETVYSSKSVYWICSKGHRFYSRIDGRSRGRGCPVCANRKVLKGYNDLLTFNPQICKEWDYKLNKKRPECYTKNSNVKVNWICPKCSGKYAMSINERTGKHKEGCPYCASKKILRGFNDLQTLYPKIAGEFSKNNIKKTYEIFPNSNIKYLWICPFCKQEYKMSPNTRIAGHQSCPKCANRWQTSFPEQAIYFYLKKLNTDVNNRVKINGYELDIYLKKYRIGIEYDGIYYHKDKKKNDLKKNNIMLDNNITLIRLKEDYMYNFIANSEKTYYEFHFDINEKNFLENIIKELIALIQRLTKKEKYIDINIKRDVSYIMEYKKGIVNNSLERICSDIAKEWDYERNYTTPSNHTEKSNDLVWWKCKKCGCSWQATIANRTYHKTGCPKCSKLKRINKYRETMVKKNGGIINKYPELKKYVSRNNQVDIKLISIGSADFIEWICESCGKNFSNHEVRTVIKNYNIKHHILCDGCRKKTNNLDTFLDTN